VKEIWISGGIIEKQGVKLIPEDIGMLPVKI
jgi:hypothetical protein